MSDKKIVVTIDAKTGKPTIEAVGFNGVGCQDATAAFENLFSASGEVTRVLKPEWHNSSDAEVEQHQTW